MFVIQQLSQWEENKSSNNEKLNCAGAVYSLLGKMPKNINRNKNNKKNLTNGTSTLMAIVVQMRVILIIKQRSCTQIKRTHN